MKNGKVILLVVGLLIGALAGWLTRPEAAEINLGPVHIEVQGQGTAEGTGPMTSGQTRHVVMFGLIGGVVGLVLGFLADRRKTG
jgi:hypothetical protein